VTFQTTAAGATPAAFTLTNLKLVTPLIESSGSNIVPVLGTGAGGGAALVSSAVNSVGGNITILTGAGAAINSPIATITLPYNLSANSFVVLSPANSASVAFNERIYASILSTTPGTIRISTGATSFAAGQTLSWNFLIVS
jgi:carbamate kinase